MADQTLRRLIDLISANDNIEVRRAAVRIAATLKPTKELSLQKALIGVLDDDDASLRGLVVHALGEIRAEAALPRLLQLVETGGAEVEGAVRAIGHLGARGTKALWQVMHRANPVLRRRIAAALALVGTESAVLATAESLLDEDPGVVEASARSLACEVPLLTAGQKRVLAEHLLEMLVPPSNRVKNAKNAGKGKKTSPNHGRKSSLSTHAALPPTSEAAVLRILAALHAPEAEDIYWARLDSHQAASLRSAALQALAALALSPSEAKLQKLLACAADEDFQVVAPALMLLKKVPASRKNVKHWLTMLKASDVAAHILAVEKLRDIDSSEVAQALLGQLHHPDKGLRDHALAALRALKAGRDALFAAVLEAQTPGDAWMLARAQVETAHQWTAAQRAKVFSQACKVHENDDHRADALWFLLREGGEEELRRQLEERALALRKKKAFGPSLAYWRLLTRDPAVGAELRFELATTALKLSNHEAAAAARDSDHALVQFSRLLQDAAFDTMSHIAKAKWLDENDLFYLGFHFAEQQRLAREFGRQVLELVIQRWPKSQVAKNAKQKLKSEGLVNR